jgi:sugar lactone lactonase YvrE
MSTIMRAGSMALWGLAAMLAMDAGCFAQAPGYNPYRPVRGLADGGGPSVPGGEWAKLPDGREMGPPASMYVDTDGESIWAFIRCDETSPLVFAKGGRFGVDCMLPDGKLKPHDTIYKFDPKGNVVKSFGAGMFIWPHGLHVDREGNVWATDAASEEAVNIAAKAGVKAGHFVRKFSPDGQVLMTLGEPGVAGNDETHFRSPAAVVTAPNGDIFVADGHGSNDRIVKYSKDGKFIKAWGKTGYGPGEFRTPHCIAMDKRGRLFVCDRANTRIQIFDQDGKYLASWHQFGMPSGIAFSINDEDLIYVYDSESDNVENPGFEQGIRIGDALTGWVKYFILDPGGNPNTTTGSGAEFGTVDKSGNVFAGEPRPRVLRKYVKVR